MAKPVVVIVGRPNVGKSTFFNRCIGEKHSIVDDQPGVTRDRIYRECDWSGHDFLLVDTGGILSHEHKAGDPLGKEILEQVKEALSQADVIIFMVDGKEGINGADEEVAGIIRRIKKPVILTVNKIDSMKENNNVNDFFSLGLGDPMPLSALTGSGAVGDLLDKIISYFPPLNGKKLTRDEELFGEDADETIEDLTTKPMSVAIIGRPNVGKSSITNMLCGQKRAIVSEVPGTTRDAVDTTFNYKGRELTLIDTAGIRRKSRVDYGIEAFSVVRSLRAIDRADVVALVLDASLEISDQDQKLASKIEEAGKACVIVLNKWDLVEDKSSGAMKRISDDVKAQLRSIAYAEVVFTSVLTKVRVQKIVEACERTFGNTQKGDHRLSQSDSLRERGSGATALRKTCQTTQNLLRHPGVRSATHVCFKSI